MTQDAPQWREQWRGQWWPLTAFLADTTLSSEARHWAQPALDAGHIGASIWWAPLASNRGFALIHHPFSAEIGFWLDPSLRGQRLASPALSAGLAAVGAFCARQSMAIVPQDAEAAQRTCQAAGMQVLARPAGRVVYVRWHRPAG